MLNRLLDKISDHPDERRNVRSLSLNMMIKSADMPLFTGTALQAFQVRLGLTTGQMGGIAASGQIAAVVAYFFLIGIADKITNRVRLYALLTAAMALYPALLLFISLGPESFRGIKFVVPAMAVGMMAESAIVSLMALIFSALFVRTISGAIQGKVMSVMGVGGGLLGLLCGYISSKALLHFDYPYGFSITFAMGLVLLLLAGVVVRNTREIPELSTAQKAETIAPFVVFREVLKTREFKLLVWPNTMRGLCGGASFFVMAVGMKQLNLGDEYAGYTSMLVFLGIMAGNVGVGVCVDRFGAGRVLLASSLCMTVSLVGIVLAPTPWMFLLFFFTMNTALALEGVTVPLAHFAIVPQKIIGAFSAIRLMLFTGAGALSIAVNGYLLEVFNAVWVFGANAMLSVAAGMLWLSAFNKGRHAQPSFDHPGS